MRFLFVSSSIYSLIILLIASRSSISQKLHFQLLLFLFWHLIFSNYSFHILFDQLRFYPCSSTTFRVHKFMISQFHSPKYNNGNWCSYTPLQFHVLYALSGPRRYIYYVGKTSLFSATTLLYCAMTPLLRGHARLYSVLYCTFRYLLCCVPIIHCYRSMQENIYMLSI